MTGSGVVPLLLPCPLPLLLAAEANTELGERGPDFQSISQFLNRSYADSTMPGLLVPPWVELHSSSRRIARSRASMTLTAERAEPTPMDMILIRPMPLSSASRRRSVRFVRLCARMTSSAARQELNSVNEARARPASSRRRRHKSTISRAASTQSVTRMFLFLDVPDVILNGGLEPCDGVGLMPRILLNKNGRPIQIRVRQ